MSALSPSSSGAERLLVLEWDGATLDALQPLAQAGLMPALASLLKTSAIWRLRWSGLGSPTAAWTTLRSGCGPWEHGVWDDSRLEHRRGWVVPVEEAKVPCPALPERLLGGNPALCLALGDQDEAAGLWSHKPASLVELRDTAACSEQLLQSLVDRARQATAVDWQLLEIRFQSLARLQHRLWHMLGVEASGAPRPWIAAAHELLRGWDRALEQLLELAESQRSAVALCSPYGFVPFREKITLLEVLRQHQLLEPARGWSKVAYGLRRTFWRNLRRLLGASRNHASQGIYAPVRAALPINWNRSRAVTLHGQHAALVYLNTPERFGTRLLRTAAAREAALAETLAALRQVRHPVTHEPLFSEVFSTADRHGGDPIQHGWPEVVAIPAPGFLTRHRCDHRHQLLRSDPTLAAVQGGDGMLVLQAPGVEPGERGPVALSCAAQLLQDALAAPEPSLPAMALASTA